jgi:hypothetical protein
LTRSGPAALILQVSPNVAPRCFDKLSMTGACGVFPLCDVFGSAVTAVSEAVTLFREAHDAGAPKGNEG